MINSVLELLHHAVTLLFGVYMSAAFLGIRMSRKNIAILCGFSAAVGAVSTLVFVSFGADFTTQVYPLIIHLPLILFLTFFYKYTPLCSTLSVLTAYLCCQISKWVGLAVLSITDAEWVYYSVRIVTTIVVFAVLIRYVSNATAQLIQKSREALLIFAILPFTYYFFDYATGVYTELIYSGEKVVSEFLGFALSIAYLLFLLVYFKQYEEKRETEQRSHIVCAKLSTVCRKATSFCVPIRTMMLTASGQTMLRVNLQTMLCPADTNTKRRESLNLVTRIKVL